MSALPHPLLRTHGLPLAWRDNKEVNGSEAVIGSLCLPIAQTENHECKPRVNPCTAIHSPAVECMADDLSTCRTAVKRSKALISSSAFVTVRISESFVRPGLMFDRESAVLTNTRSDSEIRPRFSTSVTFDALWFRNKAAHNYEI